VVSPDQLTLYFCDTDRLGSIHLPENQGLEDVWFATRTNTDEPFSNVQSLGPAINTSNSEVLGSVSADGLTLYFSRSSGNSDIYQATRGSVDEQFTDVVSLGPGVNTPDEQAMPFVTNDGLTLVYEVAPAGQLLSNTSDVDIWMATRETTAEQFGSARPLAMNSTSADDWYPSLSSDGLTLFTSDWVWQGERPGSPGYFSTWVSTRVSSEEPFGMPVLITDLWPGSEFTAANIANSFISQDWPAPGSKLYWMDQRYPGTSYPDPKASALDIYQADWIPYLDADFDSDGDVDGDDFLYWQINDGSPAGLQLWQDQFGNVASSAVAASTGVPEPATGLMLMLGMMALTAGRRAAMSKPIR
jgi:WD40-like Beta Propeller Repeat